MGNRPKSKQTIATNICPMLERKVITKTNLYPNSAPLTWPKLLLTLVTGPPAERDSFATSKEFLTKIKISCFFLTQSFTITIVVKAIDTWSTAELIKVEKALLFSSNTHKCHCSELCRLVTSGLKRTQHRTYRT